MFLAMVRQSVLNAVLLGGFFSLIFFSSGEAETLPLSAKGEALSTKGEEVSVETVQSQKAEKNEEKKLKEKSIVVPKGASVRQISQLLEEEELIGSSVLWELMVRLRGQAPKLKAGEYRFPENVSGEEIAARLFEGKAVQHRMTVPEGWTSWQVVQQLNASEELEGEKIETIPAEGSILAETYFIQKGEDRNVVLQRMQAAMSVFLNELWAKKEKTAGPFLKTPADVVTLASIVEKETALASERPLIAAVYLNRLEKGMRLQADPTIIYGLTKGGEALNRGLRRSEIDDSSNLYNTYRHKGLPPGPIANPGRDALEAVLNPKESSYLFFVADGTGGHRFAETLDEHNKNVASWRKIEKEQKK